MGLAAFNRARKLKKEREQNQPIPSLPDLSSMTIEQLKQYASENNIGLIATATTKPVIISEIQKALENRAV